MEDAEKDKQKKKFFLKQDLLALDISSRTFYGATYLFDRIGENLVLQMI